MKHRRGLRRDGEMIHRRRNKKESVDDGRAMQFDVFMLLGGVIAVYSNALQAGFTFDDRFAVEENRDVLGQTTLVDLLHHDFWGQDISKDVSHKSYRPLTIALFRMQASVQKLLGRKVIRADVFHTVSIALHFWVCVQVYTLGIYLFRMIQGKNDVLTARTKALIAAAVFAVHPIHTEAVSGIVGQAELICALICLAALRSFIHSVHYDNVLGITFFLLSMALAFISSFAKEIGITVVGVIQMFELIFTRQQITGIPLREYSRWCKVIRCSALVAVLCSYICTRKAVAGDHLVRIYRKLENPVPFHPSFLSRILTTAHIHGKYAQLLVAPLEMSADWSYKCIDFVNCPVDLRLLPAACLYALLGHVAMGLQPWKFQWKSFTFAGSSQEKMLIFFTVMLILPFLPSANIFFYVGTMVGERLLYLPSLGYCLLLALMFERVLSWMQSQGHFGMEKVPFILLGIIIAGYGIRTYTRNKDWFDNKALFTSAMKVCPKSGKVQLNYAILQLRQFNYTGALHHLKEAQDIEPTYCEPDYWRGKVFYDMSLWQRSTAPLKDSLIHLEEALECKWVFAESVKLLNKAYFRLSKEDKSNGIWFEKWALILLRKDVNETAQAKKYLLHASMLYAKSGSDESALAVAKRAATLDQTDSSCFTPHGS